MERCPSWLKEHAWKACVGHKLTAGSNPALSAIFNEFGDLMLNHTSSLRYAVACERHESNAFVHYFLTP